VFALASLEKYTLSLNQLESLTDSNIQSHYDKKTKKQTWLNIFIVIKKKPTK